jgi:peptidyl-prolyl cis-trans isomerase A (cyclophilin A)
VMRGQMILEPVRIVRAVRIDGTPKPTGRPKIWQMLEGVRNRR